MKDLKLPKIPFTMKEFEVENNLNGLGLKHYQAIHKRLKELGLVRRRKWRGKSFPEQVWILPSMKTETPELEERLRGLRA